MWIRSNLEEVSIFISRGISPKYIDDGGIRVLNQKCIRNHEIDYDLARRHNFELKKFSEDRFIKKGDVLINSTGQGTLGRVAQVIKDPKEPTTVDSHITIVRPKKELFYLEYFGYAAISIEEKIKNSGQGASGQTELAKSKVKNEFEITFPKSLKLQQEIVAKLDQAFAEIDSLIKLSQNNASNSNSLIGRIIPNIIKKYSSTKIKSSIGNAFNLSSGKFLPRREMCNNGSINVFGGNGIAGKHNAHNLEGENIIIGRVGAKCGNVHYVNENIWLTDNAMFLHSFKYEFNLEFLALILSQLNFGQYARQSAQPAISFSSIKDVLISFPKDINEQKEIVKVVLESKNLTEFLFETYKQKCENYQVLKSKILSKELSKEKKVT